jgi:hypothetical protein
MCFTYKKAEELFQSALGDDISFLEHYMSVNGNARRGAWIDKHGRPNLSSVRQNLESELVKYQT